MVLICRAGLITCLTRARTKVGGGFIRAQGNITFTRRGLLNKLLPEIAQLNKDVVSFSPLGPSGGDGRSSSKCSTKFAEISVG